MRSLFCFWDLYGIAVFAVIIENDYLCGKVIIAGS